VNLQDLEKNAADLQAKLDEMNKTITKMKAQPSGLWKPAIGEGYYYIGCDGFISVMKNDGTIFDKDIISMGNAYRTQEEAERARDKRVVTQRLRELAGGYRFKAGVTNWELYYHTVNNSWQLGTIISGFRAGNVYFRSDEEALVALNELGSRLDVLLEIEE